MTRPGSVICSRIGWPTSRTSSKRFERVAIGGTALDPEVVTQLIAATRRADSLSMLTSREREVLALMAEGRSNAAIATALVVSEGAVEKHVANIFAKLDLPVSEKDHRRVCGGVALLGILKFSPSDGLSLRFAGRRILRRRLAAQRNPARTSPGPTVRTLRPKVGAIIGSWSGPRLDAPRGHNR